MKHAISRAGKKGVIPSSSTKSLLNDSSAQREMFKIVQLGFPVLEVLLKRLLFAVTMMMIMIIMMMMMMILMMIMILMTMMMMKM